MCTFENADCMPVCEICGAQLGVPSTSPQPLAQTQELKFPQGIYDLGEGQMDAVVEQFVGIHYPNRSTHFTKVQIADVVDVFIGVGKAQNTPLPVLSNLAWRLVKNHCDDADHDAGMKVLNTAFARM